MTFATSLRSRLPEIAGIDLRTLALFRVSLASVLLWTLLQRFGDIGAFYTDAGTLPRSWLIDVDGPWRVSVHLANGGAWFAAVLLLVHALAVAALLVGYRTRLAAFVSWALLVSLHNRNPLVLLGGDYLMVCLLFWGLFLPLNARWSVDAALATNPAPSRNLHVSWASFGLIVQVLSVYFFSAIFKNAPEWWPQGTAVYYALHIDYFAAPAGVWLRETLPGLLKPLSYYVYFLELLGPLIAFSPLLTRPLRFIVMLGFMAMHTGFIVLLNIGHFPFVSLASLTVLLGGWFWDWAAVRFDHGRRLRIYYDIDCGFCLKSCLLFRHFLVLPRTEIEPAQNHARARALMEAHYSWVVIDADDVAHTKWHAFVALLRHSLLFRWVAPLASLRLWERPGAAIYDWVARNRDAFGRVTAALLPDRHVSFEVSKGLQRLAGGFVFLVLAWNLATIRTIPFQVFEFVSPPLFLLRLDQGWDMFSPYPSRDDGWWVIPGKLEDGREIDLLHPEREHVSYDKPRYVSQEHGNVRWQTYRLRLFDHQFRHHRLFYARYLCRQWNAEARVGQRLLKLNLVYMLETTQPAGAASPVEQRILWRHECVSPASNSPAKLDSDLGEDAAVDEDR